MKKLVKVMSVAFGVFLMAACGNGKTDESANTGTSESLTDSIHTDTIPVSEADSSDSFRNDRGTDSVSNQVNKGVPRNP